MTIGSILSDFAREDGPTVYRDGQMVKVAGVISTYKTRTTRNNTLMAYVSLEDDTGGWSCWSLPAPWTRAADTSGRTRPSWPAAGSPSGTKEPQLMADEIRPWTHRGGGAAGGGGAEALHPPARPGRSQDPKGEAGPLLFPGEQPVVLYYQDIRKRSKGYCMIHPSLLADLRERLGEENVVVQ